MTIFFDFNGTIIDDLELTFNLLNQMLVEEGHQTVTLERYLDIFDFPIKDYYIKAGFDFKKSSFEELAVRFINRYQPQSMHLKLHEGLIQTVLDLKKEGHRVVVLSASKYNNLLEQMKHYQIDTLFDDILGINDIYANSKVELAKKYVEENKLVSDEIFVVGDTLHDNEVATALNGKMIYYSKGHQARHRFKDGIIIDHFKELKKEIYKNGR
ncbi:HAD family hydrolase [Acholeplasma hippikon]|uniref:Phosphoglycolate phosphatase n=1 Tax=Acholeplasma hippikon TaxID=264636 RepID=A0A449BKA3_9MOLU|nr:HAD hydrolase-like protein [Acholeplasma hippikon]VEU82879.1 phosphoglycolate phosphatase [Acholeplasma hippikon]